VENIEELKREIFSWAAESGQELVAIEISRMWFRLGGNTGALKLHQIEDADGKADWRAINNNRQQIFRWLRGETKAARTKTKRWPRRWKRRCRRNVTHAWTCQPSI
jgi:hypothetical protein